MSLAPSWDATQGTVTLWCAADHADRATTLDRRTRVSCGMMDLDVAPATRLRGTVAAPPDKSISHRAALLGAMASEPVRITGYLDAEDTNSTLAAVAALGALVDRSADESSSAAPGCARRARRSRRSTSATRARSCACSPAGWPAQEGRSFVLDGDASIRRRPVDRIAAPLRAMGAEVEATDGRFPPFTVRGARLRSIAYDMPVASAQVKSCVLIAGLGAEGPTTVTEPQPSRDHTERMLTRLGAAVHRNGRRVTVVPVDELVGGHLARARRPLLGGVLARRRRDRPRRGDPRDEHGRPTGPGSASLRMLERMGADIRGDLEAPDGDVIAPEEPVARRRGRRAARCRARPSRGRRSRSRSTSCRSSGCSAASRRARRSSAAPRSCG